MKKNSLEEKIIHTLWAKSFQAELAPDIHAFKKLLIEYLDRGVQKIRYHTSVPLFEQSELIKHSIGNEIWNDLTTALKISALLYSKNEINRVIELVENKDRHKLFNAMEMLEMVLPKRVARQVNDLFDYILEPPMLRKRETDYDTSLFLKEIIRPGAPFNNWTKAICLYTSLKNDKWELIRNLSPEPELYENIVLTETRTYVMNSIQQTAHADY